jgi:hypothetical protein
MCSLGIVVGEGYNQFAIGTKPIYKIGGDALA